MIYRGPGFLVVVSSGSSPPPPTSSVNKFDWRHTGRLRKRDNLLTGEEELRGGCRVLGWGWDAGVVDGEGGKLGDGGEGFRRLAVVGGGLGLLRWGMGEGLQRCDR
jgi:hypothetical protein